MQKNIIKYAKHITTQNIVHIDDVPRGLKCKCICIECSSEMLAIRGISKTWHFRHFVDSNCKGGQETAIHKLAKQIIVNNNSIKLPFKILQYSEAKEEVPFKGFVPDIIAVSDEKPIIIEIFVSHRCESQKEEYYRNNLINSLEIDLSNISYHISVKDLEELILRNSSNKRIIYWDINIPLVDHNKKDKKNADWENIVFIVTVIISWFIFFKKKKN